MSKRRAVILAVTIEGLTQAQAARRYQVSESFVSRLLTRYRDEGEAAFEPRSRRPLRSPSAVPDATVELIVNLRKDLTDRGLDAGPETIAWRLQRTHGIAVSRSTIRRRLLDAGMITPEPKKRPRSSFIRFAARAPQRVLAERLRPLAPRGWHRHRDPHLARRPLPLRPLGHRPPPRHRPDRHGHVPRNHSPARLSGLGTRRQRHGLHKPLRRRTRRPQPSQDPARLTLTRSGGHEVSVVRG
jgi:transposase